MTDGIIAKARGSQLRSIKEQFGFVFQGGALFDSLTVFDNVAFPLRHKAEVTPAELKDRVEEMLNQVGLSGYGDRYPFRDQRRHGQEGGRGPGP